MTYTRDTSFEDNAYQLMQNELDRVLTTISKSNAVDTVTRQLFMQNLSTWRHVLAVSPFITNYLTRHPDTLPKLIDNQANEFDPTQLNQHISDKLLPITESVEFDRQLRRLRNEQMILIALRDLQGLASLEKTLAHLSTLADTLVEACLRWQYEKLAERHGYPLTDDGQHMPLVVLGMGKLGAEELNFSSDIDLILAYEKDGMTNGQSSIEHHEFFLRLTRRFHQSLHKTTEDGFVFRVDLRLRPYGNSGPLAMSFDAMEEYYQTQGREWERYAMIKARAIGMNIGAGEQLLAILQPFVYRRYLDFGVIQSLRDLKAMIDQETIKKDRQDNLKLGAGGIREVEFIAQVFQLMRGGQDLALRSRSTPAILNHLAKRSLLSQQESDQLITAWRFLRYAENHIQSIHDRQEHNLPKSAIDQQRLALSMGYDRWSSFIKQLSVHRQIVQACFDNIFAETRETGKKNPTRLFWLEITEESLDESYLAGLGYQYSLEAAQKIQGIKTKSVYRRLSGRSQALLDELIPAIIDLAADFDSPDESLTRLLSVMTSIARRESYLALLTETPTARQQLAKLCSASSWITQVITRYPVLLDELIDPRRLYEPPGRNDINVELTRLLTDMDPEDVEAQMERLRIFKQAQQLRIAAADTMQTMPLMRVSDHLTWIAESLVNVALELAWEHLIQHHGNPVYELDGEKKQAQFGIIGLGKLGGIELGYGSDLDLIFVHDSKGKHQYTNGKKPIENSMFFTRLAQRLLHLLSTLTPSGTLYEIDMRLRPNGKSGLLISSLQALSDYQHKEAWTWEHQALVKARPIAGGETVCNGFQKIRNEILSLERDPAILRNEVINMRQRMHDELDQSDNNKFDLKQGTGGIVDIEFMVQYMALLKARSYPQLLELTDNIRLIEAMTEVHLIAADQGSLLIDAYQKYRACLHHRVLQGLDQCVALSMFTSQRAQIIQVWKQLFEYMSEEREK